MQSELTSLQLEVAKLRAENSKLEKSLAVERLAREHQQELAIVALAELESVKKAGSSNHQEVYRQLDALQSEVASLHTDHAALLKRYNEDHSISQENVRTTLAQANQEAAEARGAMEKLRREKEETDRKLWRTVADLHDQSVRQEAVFIQKTEAMQSNLSRVQSSLSSVKNAVAVLREEKEALQKQEAKFLAEIGDLRSENDKMRREYAVFCTRMSDFIHTARHSEVFSLQAGSGGSRAPEPASSTVSTSAIIEPNSRINLRSGRDKE